MPKTVLLILTSVFLINFAKGNGADTSIFYYKNDLQGSHRVNSIDEADYFRIILPPDSGDHLKNVKEYYKNGSIKFVGKFDPRSNRGYLGDIIRLNGDCVSFFPNGKRYNIAHYSDGDKEGNEYFFYPNGSIYCYMKHLFKERAFKTFFWDCYDVNGSMICKTGNGKWIIYDESLKHILSSGDVKNGYAEGEWHGRTGDADSIKYMYIYDKGVIVSATGYDKAGVAYPFTKLAEKADYKDGAVNFVETFRSHLKLPKGPDGKKMFVDTVHISFIIEKDGQVSSFKVLGNVNDKLRNALAEAFAKCGGWSPSRYYGVPLRTEVIFPVDFISVYLDAYSAKGNITQSYHRTVNFQFRIIGF
ncbi:MAG TPA: hypothetical protein VIM16_24375 [Mucilaginibacter sp.]|jgi:antitoxin component YwqK of YwqJK toxin-antitoxin module